MEQFTKSVRQHLIRKYNIHFNFAHTTPINQIFYNHTLTPSTIHFKDALIFADSNQYLKRYYFLKNAMEKDQIFDRIQLLAQFYGSAVLLRYEYPMMILTRTKSVFLKRLKRLKNTLLEQGSSDGSKSNNDYKIVSISNSQFLQSLSSSELQRKSLDQSNKLQLDFSLADEDCEIYEVFGQGERNQSKDVLFGSGGINKLGREMNYQLVLQKEQKENQLQHLVADFDQFDQEEVIRRYKQLMERENKTNNSSKKSILHKDSIKSAKNVPNAKFQRLNDLLDKKPMTSSVTISGLEDQRRYHYQNSQQNIDSFKKKSLMNPASPRVSQFPQQNHNYNAGMKKSSYYQFELDHNKLNRYNEHPIAEDQREDSPKQPGNFRQISRGDSWGFMSSRDNSSKDNIYDNYKQKITSPITKYSSIIGSNELKSQPKVLNRWQVGQKEKGSPFKSKPQYKQMFSGYERDKYSGQPNRMTSINININNLEEKKERVNVKVNKFGEEFEEEDKNYRAEKKKKIREKAAALLNRVKSQEYIRPLDNFDYPQLPPNPRPYFERYYN